MVILEGHVVRGVEDFRRRITEYPEAFERATGEKLFPGTLNIKVRKPVRIREHFRIPGLAINEPGQDLLFEVCRINGIWAYRIRPWNPKTGSGGHGDDTLEIACSQELPNVKEGSKVVVAFFRDDAALTTSEKPDVALM